MRMKRTPRANDDPRAAPSHAAPSEPLERVGRRPPPPPQPHTDAEEKLAYVSMVLLLLALVLACVSLDSKSWHVLPGSPSEGFGVVRAHVGGESYRLESLGLVWPVYTASRCGLGFTIIGVLMAAWALHGTLAFIRHNRGSFVRVLCLSLFTSTWFVWAVGLYAALFPTQPFHGDLAFLPPDANATAWTSEAHTREYHTMGRQQLLGHQPGPWRLQQLPQQQRLWDEGAETIEQLQPVELTSLGFDPAPEEPRSHSDALRVVPPANHASSSRPPPSPDSIYRRHMRPQAGDVPSFPGSDTDSSNGVPSFPSPTDTPGSGGGGGTTPNPYEAAPTPAEIAKQEFYARTAYAHLHSVWRYGTGYFLVLGSALSTLALPLAFVLFRLGAWLLDRHKQAEVQQRWAVPLVATFYLAWLLALIGIASRFWKVSDSPDVHFGLDRYVGDGEVHRLAGVRFPDKHGRIQSTSAGVLALGVMGVVSGWFTCCFAVYHVYDRAREPALVFVLSTLTALLWFVALVAYGAAFPHYIGGAYFELGWSFWMLLASTCIFALPLLALLGWKALERARATTRAERLMAVPSCLALMGLGLTMAAMGTDFWSAGSTASSEHLGLVRGRLGGVWMLYTQLARTASVGVVAAGAATLTLLLCGLAIQVPVALLGLQYVSGTHDRCGKQMPLLATALSLSTTLLYALGVAAYALLLPWNDLPAGYDLSHSWRVQVCATIFSLGSAVGFGALAQPPPPGEPNILAAAIGGTRSV